MSREQCAIFRWLCIMGGLIAAGLSILGGGMWLMVQSGYAREVRIAKMEERQQAQDKQLDEMRADIKELLRRVPNRGGGPNP